MSQINILIKQPSAFLPILMSLGALAVLFGFVAMFGFVKETDEGTAAHLWQLLMGLQIPVIIFFAFKYLPKNQNQALKVLAIQAAAFAASLITLYTFEHL